jgi:hypothetical protein
MLLFRPIKKGPRWIPKPVLKFGAQVNFYNQNSPQTSFSSSMLVKNTVVRSGKPEVLLVAEIGYGLKPFRYNAHGLSVSYAYGLSKTIQGTITSNSNVGEFRYSDAGMYLGIKYTFWFTKGYRTSYGA